MRLYLILSVVLSVFAMSLFNTAVAQSTDYMASLEKLNRINSYRPEQSPRHERSREIFSDRVLDRTNKVVGEVRDLILTRNGSIAHLDVEFDRLRLTTDRLVVNYPQLGIRPVSNGYKMSYTDDQIIELVPELLANIETAAGEDSDSYSLKKIIGSRVRAKDGRKLGKVEDVLFDSLGGRAEFLLVEMTQRSVRGELVAIPFSEARYGKKIQVKDSFADAMIAYARSR